jgi:UDP-glucose 4-epimerase
LGNDYDTTDGTCIRDYVHVMDIADAHVKAYNYLYDKKQSDVFNLGTSVGYSVKEIVKKVEKITDRKIPIEFAPRREGDPAVLVADNKKAKEILGWIPRKTLSDTISSAYNWEKILQKRFVI